MANQYVSKVVLANGTVLMDLTGDTITAANLLEGVTAHDKSGAAITGTCTYDVDSGDATAAAGEILAGKTAYARGAKLTGTMPNNGGTNVVVSTKAGTAIPQGYSDGSAKAILDATSLANLTANNVREGITILDVTGEMSGSEDVSAQTKSVTPTFTAQTISPDTPTYNYLSQVTVAPITVNYSDNSAGGQTVTIGAT